jgi:hypothetical protein
MKKNHETGHSKNVANFEDLINGIELIDTKYKPQSAGLQLPALKEKHANCRSLVETLSKANQDYHLVTNDREKLFQPLGEMCTRIYNSMIAAGANEQTLDNLKSLIRKFRGARKKKVEKAVAPNATATVAAEQTPVIAAAKTISVSQRSYGNQVDHFSDVVTALSVQSGYQPNETELSVESLKELVVKLRAKNSEAMSAANKLNAVRNDRNQALYGPDGLLDLAKKSKAYVKSVFGVKSMEYKRMTRLKFSKKK